MLVCWRRPALPSFIAQPRCTVSEVRENGSSPDHRRLGGESASSADKVLARDVSARCTGAVHAAHYDTRVLIALGARCVLRQAARGAASQEKQLAGGRRRRLPVGPRPTCQQVKPLFIGVHPAFFGSLISSARTRGYNRVCPYLSLGVPLIGAPTRSNPTKGLKLTQRFFPGVVISAIVL